MHAGKSNIIFCLIFLFIFYHKGAGQLCPPNLDFETGNFSNWECKYGNARIGFNGENAIVWEGTGILATRHSIIDAANQELDEYGYFPQACPYGGRYSVRLGNNQQMAEADGVFYTFEVPTGVTTYSIKFYYAVVLQNPGHSPEEQPRFRARVFNVTDNVPIDCADFDFTASSSLPGFQASPDDATVLYKDWTPVTLNLGAYAGKTIRLEFITSDCTLGGHFGYAYLDVGSICSNVIAGAGICPDATAVTLTAPHGFATYTWYADNTYATVLATTQSLVLSPPPPPGTGFPVIVVPYPGYGCRDTIITILNGVPNPTADAGTDKVICSEGQAILGGNSSIGDYNWSPASLLIASTGPNAVTLQGVIQAPTAFYLEVTDINGCKGYDTVLVTPVYIDTAMQVTGDLLFCEGVEFNTEFRLRSTDPAVQIQWLRNTEIIPGATQPVFYPYPTGAGVYMATLRNQTCYKTGREVMIELIENPRADFLVPNPIQCLMQTATFKNTTVEAPGDDHQYSWKLSDGSNYTVKDLVKTFTTEGSYEIRLKVVSKDGCSDSISKRIEIISRCGIYVPSGFTPNNDGLNDIFKPVLLSIKKLHYFTVYDRQGNLIFSTKKEGEGWDGTYKGINLTTSVFVWMLEYDSNEQNNILLKGTVTLIR